MRIEIEYWEISLYALLIGILLNVVASMLWLASSPATNNPVILDILITGLSLTIIGMIGFILLSVINVKNNLNNKSD